tara:strand:+ start:937 stop:1419 length:483 start_codon:yes stop_codon:yes gene_type:complete
MGHPIDHAFHFLKKSIDDEDWDDDPTDPMQNFSWWQGGDKPSGGKPEEGDWGMHPTDEMFMSKQGDYVNAEGRILCQIEAAKGRAVPATWVAVDHVNTYFCDPHYDEVERVNTGPETLGPLTEESQEEYEIARHWWDNHVHHNPEGWYAEPVTDTKGNPI